MVKKARTTSEIIENLRIAADRLGLLESIKDRMLTIVEQSDPEIALRAICEAANQFCKAQYVLVQLMDRSGKYLAIRSHTGPIKKNFTFHVDLGKGVAGRCARTKTIQNVPDVLEDPDFIRAFPLAPKVKSELAIPLISGKTLLGVFNLLSSELDGFTPDREEGAEVFARLAAVCVDRILTRERAKTLDDALGVILDGALCVSRADSGFIQIVNTDTRTLEIRVKSGGQIDKDKRIYKIGEEGITGRVAQTLKPECLADVTADPTYIPFFKNIRSELTVPLVYEDNLRGVLDVNSRQFGWFTPNDVDNLSKLSAQAVVAIVLAQHKDRARQLAALDAVENTAASAVHYLKNQVAALTMGVVKLKKELSRERLTPEGRQAIDKEFERFSEVINPMDDFCQKILQPGNRIIQKKSFDLREFITHQLKLSGIDGVIPFDMVGPTKGIRMLSDEKILSEILQNLLKNAREALDGRSNPKVILSYGHSPSAPRHVFIAVADNGKGIATTDVKTIFSPFTFRKRQGAGIGLAVSHGLLKRLGGTVEVSTKSGQGSEFVVTIPIE